MLHIGLDLASKTVGAAIRDPNAERPVFGSYESKVENYIHKYVDMCNWVFDFLGKHVSLTQQENLLVIEDVYVGVNPISTIDAARTQGLVIDRYHQLTGRYPRIVTAIQARKFLGLDTQMSKVEYQLFTVDRFKLATVSEGLRGLVVQTGNHWEVEYKRLSANKRAATSKVLRERIDREVKELNRVTKNAFNRLCTQFTKETGVTEHSSDAIILSMYEGE